MRRIYSMIGLKVHLKKASKNKLLSNFAFNKKAFIMKALQYVVVYSLLYDLIS